jgi:hypothetical protein
MCKKDLQGTFFALSQDSKIRYFSLMKLLLDMLMFVGNLEFRNQFFTLNLVGGDEVNIKDGENGEI